MNSSPAAVFSEERTVNRFDLNKHSCSQSGQWPSQNKRNTVSFFKSEFSMIAPQINFMYLGQWDISKPGRIKPKLATCRDTSRAGLSELFQSNGQN